MSWTDARIDLLRSSWEKGMTASQIAEMLGEGVSRNAVIGKAHRLGLQARPSPVKGGEAAIADVVAASVASPVAAPVAAAPAATRAVAPAAPVAVRKIRPVVGGKPARTTLLDLSEKVCKWPIGHPGDSDFHFCGKPSATGFPYCMEHCAVAYQAQQPRRDRNRNPPPVMPGFGPRR